MFKYSRIISEELFLSLSFSLCYIEYKLVERKIFISKASPHCSMKDQMAGSELKTEIETKWAQI